MEKKLYTPQDIEDRMEKEYPTVYKGFRNIETEQLILFCRKHLDYGMDNVTAGTNLNTPEEIKFALQGLWFRISDKVNRWKNLLIEGKTVQNESLLDTFQDIVNYGIIAQLVARGQWKKDEIFNYEEKDTSEGSGN